MTDKKKELPEDDDLEEIRTVLLEFEDGHAEECEILDTIEIEGKTYVALMPLDKDEYMVFEFKLGEVQDEIEIINISDPNVYQNVVRTFEELFEFDDDDDDFDEDDDDDDDDEEEDDEDDDDEDDDVDEEDED